MSEQQKQKAGDNSQQFQANTLIVNTGIDEKRAREIVDEKLNEVVMTYTREARAVAENRIHLFANDLIPKLVKANLLDELKDPSLQILLAEAQKTAASTERENDYSLLTELLIQRVKIKNDRNERAGIGRAVEIVSEISGEALLGLTVAQSFASLTPVSGKIQVGVKVLADLYERVIYDSLPTGEAWLENLDVLDAIRMNQLSSLKKSDVFLGESLSGYVDVGIDNTTENYQQALEIIKGASLPIDILCDHELRPGYSRLNVVNINKLDSYQLLQNITFEKDGISNTYQIPIKISPAQKLALENVYALYNNDLSLRSENLIKFLTIFDSYKVLHLLREWWDSITQSFTITAVGKVLARANAQRCDPAIPPLKKA